MAGCVGTLSFKRDQLLSLDVAGSLAKSSICTFNSPITLSFRHLFFLAYSVYQKCKHLSHHGHLQANISDNLLSSPCSNVVFRIVAMDPKLVSSNNVTGLISLKRALKYCYSYRLLSIREDVRNKLRANLLFPNSSRSI